jgi:osmotically-inducible protein OsmY
MDNFGGLPMKTGKALWITAPALMVSLLALPAFAQSDSYNNNTPPAGTAAASENSTTTTSTGNSVSTSAENAAHDAAVDTENAYHHVKRDVKDVALEARVKAMLHEDKYTRGTDVHVTANRGIVTLTGQVPNERTARHARHIVASVYGVKAVYNELRYPRADLAATSPDADSTGVAHPAYSHEAPVESVPNNQ